MCCYVCPGGSREILEPAIKRVELRIKSSVLDTCLLPLVEHEVKSLGYAETAGAREELKNCCWLYQVQKGQSDK